MTTIATDGKIVAADSMITSDLVYSRTAKKIFLINGEIVGTRGLCDLGEAYFEWLRTGADRNARPIWPDEDAHDDVLFEALHLTKTGIYVVDGPNFARTKMPAPFAIGSGGQVAMGAMLAGASPIEAVRIAGKLDPHTGGSVYSLKLPG